MRGTSGDTIPISVALDPRVRGNDIVAIGVHPRSSAVPYASSVVRESYLAESGFLRVLGVLCGLEIRGP